MNRFDHCTHPGQDFCDCDWCRYIAQTEALTEMYANTENRQDEPFIKYVRSTCLSALNGGQS